MSQCLDVRGFEAQIEAINRGRGITVGWRETLDGRRVIPAGVLEDRNYREYLDILRDCPSTEVEPEDFPTDTP